MSTVTLHVGDVLERMASIPDGSVDLLVTSPPIEPFLALRSYLPADHEHKAREIGSEATPADFLDTLLALTAEWRRVLAPHGSLCVELGDTYSGSGGAGGDYGDGGMREGQARFRQHNLYTGGNTPEAQARGWGRGGKGDGKHLQLAPYNGGPGWPLAKSLTGIPTLYTWSLAYGRNLLTAPMSARELCAAARATVLDWEQQGYLLTARDLLEWMEQYLSEYEHLKPTTLYERWRIRNLLVWARPNPPVGALGDKFRPATSYITVATTAARRWFDLDAVRTEHQPNTSSLLHGNVNSPAERNSNHGRVAFVNNGNPAGAPPLDWHDDLDDGPTGDRLWQMPTQPYSGAHYATYPLELPRRLIDAMCPREVCRVCGKARARITGAADYVPSATYRGEGRTKDHPGRFASMQFDGASRIRTAPTLGWSDCGHDNYRTGIVLDPFLGSGTTAVAAALSGRDSIGIDLDDRNTGLVHQRLAETVHIVDTNYRADRTVSADRPIFGNWHTMATHATTPGRMRGSLGGTVPTSSATEIVWSCDAPLPDQRDQIDGQTNLFDLMEPT